MKATKIEALRRHRLTDKYPDLDVWSPDPTLTWVVYKGVRFKERELEATGPSAEKVAAALQAFRNTCPLKNSYAIFSFLNASRLEDGQVRCSITLSVWERGVDTETRPPLAQELLKDIQEALDKVVVGP